MNLVRQLAAATVVIGVGLGGCGGVHDKPAPFSRLSRGESDSLNAEHSRFPDDREPALMAETHFAAGQLAESQGNAQTAIRQYRQAIKLDPGHTRSLYRLGVVQAQSGALGDAIGTWQRYLEATGEDAGAYANLGFCHELAGDPVAAEAAYKRGVAKDGKNVPCRVNYGLMLAKANRANEALIQFQAVLTEAQAHYNLGSVYEQQGKTAQARGEYHKALELDPGLAEARARLARVE